MLADGWGMLTDNEREENYSAPLMLPSSLSRNMISKPGRGRPNMVKTKLELNTDGDNKKALSLLSDFTFPEPDKLPEMALKEPADVMIILMNGIFTEA